MVAKKSIFEKMGLIEIPKKETVVEILEDKEPEAKLEKNEAKREIPEPVNVPDLSNLEKKSEEEITDKEEALMDDFTEFDLKEESEMGEFIQFDEKEDSVAGDFIEFDTKEDPEMEDSIQFDEKEDSAMGNFIEFDTKEEPMTDNFIEFDTKEEPEAENFIEFDTKEEPEVESFIKFDTKEEPEAESFIEFDTKEEPEVESFIKFDTKEEAKTESFIEFDTREEPPVETTSRVVPKEEPVIETTKKVSFEEDYLAKKAEETSYMDANEINDKLDLIIGAYEKNKLLTIDEIYRNSQLESDTQKTIFMADVYLKAIPENLPVDLKRDTVLNIMKVSNVNLDALLNDAYKRIDSLNTVLEDTVATTEEIFDRNESSVKELEKRIRDIRNVMNNRRKFQEDQNTMIEYEIQKVINIVEFIKPKK